MNEEVAETIGNLLLIAFGFFMAIWMFWMLQTRDEEREMRDLARARFEKVQANIREMEKEMLQKAIARAWDCEAKREKE